MMCMPMMLIKCSLISMLLLSGVAMVMSFVSGNIWGGIFSVSLFVVVFLTLYFYIKHTSLYEYGPQ